MSEKYLRVYVMKENIGPGVDTAAISFDPPLGKERKRFHCKASDLASLDELRADGYKEGAEDLRQIYKHMQNGTIKLSDRMNLFGMTSADEIFDRIPASAILSQARKLRDGIERGQMWEKRGHIATVTCVDYDDDVVYYVFHDGSTDYSDKVKFLQEFTNTGRMNEKSEAFIEAMGGGDGE